MSPRGKIKELIEAMQAQPEKVLWSPPECGEIVGASVSSSLAPALRHGWLFKHMDGRRVHYSLQPPEEEPEEVEELPPFNAALWADGELVIIGAQQNTDGSITLVPDQVRQLCRLLHGQGPEA